MTRRPTAVPLAPHEQWFVDNGLPYFVDPVRAEVRRRLSVPRRVAVAALALLLGTGAGWAAGSLVDPGLGVAVGLWVALIVVVLWAAFVLRAGNVARWAARRTLGSLGLLFPLVTRALPLLLLFITFLFINTEVWQVCDRLSPGVMTGAVLVFAAVAVAFLLARLPEEVRGLDDGLDTARVRAACAGTPLEPYADLDQASGIDEPILGLEKANLVLVLLITQAIQVLLLSLCVFVFFLGFGGVTIDDHVIEAWLGAPPHPVAGGLISRELLRVAVFLASFSGLYFTVYAVTDEHYRKDFFTQITTELERAVGAREAYRALQRSVTGP